MNDIRKQLTVLAALACMVTSAGCTQNGTADTQNTQSETESADEDSAETAAPQAKNDTESSLSTELLSNLSGSMLPDITPSKSDLNTEWDSGAVTLEFGGDTVTPSATDGLTIENGAVTITKGGDYVLSGTLDDGRIIINLADQTEKVHLILNGASVSCSTGAPLTVLQADKVILTLADGTDNTLSDAKEYTVFDLTETEKQFPNACIAAKCDLTINGSGSLNVSGNYKNGIHCTDDLKIISGILTVTAANHGIRSSDSVVVYDGKVTVTAGSDGIKSTNADTDGKGYICLAGGSVTVISEQDGVDAASALYIQDGSLDITAGGGTANAEPHTGDFMGGGFGGGRPGRPDNDTDGSHEHSGGKGGHGRSRQDSGEASADALSFQPLAAQTMTAETAESTEDNSVSRKGIKAAQIIAVSGGTVTINAADDAVHSDSEINFSGNAALTAASGDDGIHAENSITFDGGSIYITESYEGIESAEITLNDGTLRVISTDDGINASDGNGGGMGFSRSGSGELYLNGGYLFVNAGGDGLDSNGNITMTGGTVVVCGPTNDGNGPLDSGDNNNRITVTGGTLLAVGSTGMMETPEANYIAAADLNASAGDLIVVTDADGKVLAALHTPKEAKGIVCSANGMSNGYYVYTGGEYSGTFNADGFSADGSYTAGTLITSGSGGGTGFGRFGGMTPPDFDGQNPPDFGNMTPPDGMTPPDFDGQNRPDFGNMTPPDGMTPPDFNGQNPHERFERSQKQDS